ncbi:DUF465 domain-containing protein [Sphingopyxis sp. PET50]|uniref:DUF465 domain-containing protein n=1 Tax=Sphingopyxis sp. PET50 TaxID=2976533 RepID=UPI0021B08EAF|nr:DUF465 domain-containing protein [Sphingopyxis sp. PET50]
MSINPRFYRLTVLHRRIDDALRRESRGHASPFRLLRLKTLKLAVRERLARLARQPAFAL